MRSRGVSIFGALALCAAIANPAGAAIVVSDENSPEAFSWTAAAGPVDHYEVQISTADPTDPTAVPGWASYQLTGRDERSVIVPPDIAEWVTVRVIARDPVGNSSLPSPESKTLHFMAPESFSTAIPSDFDGDAIPDLLVHDTAAGEVRVTLSSSPDPVPIPEVIEDVIESGWQIVAQGDFDGDEREDLFWRNVEDGRIRIWFEVGMDYAEEIPSLENPDLGWSALAVGDFDGDGRHDVFWQNAVDGSTRVWFMEGGAAEEASFPRVRSASWRVEATGDFDASSTDDLFWRHVGEGLTSVWLIDGELVEFAASRPVADTLEVFESYDQDDDGADDLVWRDLDSGDCQLWRMSGGDLIAPPADHPDPACVAGE
jgi:hypothetical protein